MLDFYRCRGFYYNKYCNLKTKMMDLSKQSKTKFLKSVLSFITVEKALQFLLNFTAFLSWKLKKRLG